MKGFDPTISWVLIEQKAPAEHSIVVRTTKTHPVSLSLAVKSKE